MLSLFSYSRKSWSASATWSRARTDPHLRRREDGARRPLPPSRSPLARRHHRRDHGRNRRITPAARATPQGAGGARRLRPATRTGGGRAMTTALFDRMLSVFDGAHAGFTALAKPTAPRSRRRARGVRFCPGTSHHPRRPRGHATRARATRRAESHRCSHPRRTPADGARAHLGAPATVVPASSCSTRPGRCGPH